MAVEGKRAGTVHVNTSPNTRMPYEHQTEAMACLDKMLDTLGSFSTMVVLPTGGGKTYTASNWLLKRALNKRRKVLWIAHRHALLDQAAESFEKYAYRDVLPDIDSFTYRVVSGLPRHCRGAQISPSDDLVIASKDSLGDERVLKRWLQGQTELFFVVDEAHHAAAKTYRRLIERVKTIVPQVAILGLTATPFRTKEEEQGLLAKIFTDGIVDGHAVRNQRGIAYQIGLQDLINRQILARPVMQSFETQEAFGDQLTPKELDNMTKLDKIPEKVARKIVESELRNRLIVDTYMKGRDRYGQTIVFAVNVNHARTLSERFNQAGVTSGYVTSYRPAAENQKTIADFRTKEIQVISNVDILTEGVDLPQTQSVFLARPTSSTILMTQMVGRALRGTKAGGTAEANIVSFVDNWSDRVAWVNPKTLLTHNATADTADTEEERERERRERAEDDIRTISLSKMEEVASVLGRTIDAPLIERIPFIECIPLGMYVFSYIERPDPDDDQQEGSDISCQVMVYTSSQDSFKKFIASLPRRVSEERLDDVEYADDSQLERMVDAAIRDCFADAAIPPVRDKDVESILKYFIQFGEAPSFYPFDAIDRARLDVGQIAREIFDKDMGPRARTVYENELWDQEDGNLLKLFFNQKRNFVQAIDIELRKLTNPELYETPRDASIDERSRNHAPEASVEHGESSTLDSESPGIEDGMHDGHRSEQETPGETQTSPTEAKVASDRGLRISRSKKSVHPDREEYESFEPYQPSGLAINEMTGRPIASFGGKARLKRVGSHIQLFSEGYLVADADDYDNVRLFEYSDADGTQRGWNCDRYTLLRVQDFAASHLGLHTAPSAHDLEKLAATEGSGFSRVEIVQDGIAAKEAVESKTIRAPKTRDATVGRIPLSVTSKPSAPPAASSGRHPAPDRLPQSEFEQLEIAPSNGSSWRRFSQRDKNARILRSDGYEHLYVRCIKIGRWEMQKRTLELYDYVQDGKVMVGWTNPKYQPYALKFASDRLKIPPTESSLRKYASECPSKVRFMRTDRLPTIDNPHGGDQEPGNVSKTRD